MGSKQAVCAEYRSKIPVRGSKIPVRGSKIPVRGSKISKISKIPPQAGLPNVGPPLAGPPKAGSRRINSGRGPAVAGQINNRYGAFRSSGFSLMELMFSVSVLAVALIFVCTTFTKMLHSTTKGGDLTAATYLCQSKLDELSNSAGKMKEVAQRAVASSNVDTGEAARYLYSGADPTLTKALNKNTYFYRITVRPILDNAEKAVYYVDVEVFWWGGRSGSGGAGSNVVMREGYGQSRVNVSRLVYVRP